MTGVIAALAGSGSAGAGAVLLDYAVSSSSGAGVRTAVWTISSDGYIYHTDNAVATQQYKWLQSGSASDYDVSVALNYGTISGTTGSWLSLGSIYDYSNTDTANDSLGIEGEIEVAIRHSSSGAIVATGLVLIYGNRRS